MRRRLNIRRFWASFVCCALLISALNYRPPKAEAVLVETSVGFVFWPSILSILSVYGLPITAAGLAVGGVVTSLDYILDDYVKSEGYSNANEWFYDITGTDPSDTEATHSLLWYGGRLVCNLSLREKVSGFAEWIKQHYSVPASENGEAGEAVAIHNQDIYISGDFILGYSAYDYDANYINPYAAFNNLIVSVGSTFEVPASGESDIFAVDGAERQYYWNDYEIWCTDGNGSDTQWSVYVKEEVKDIASVKQCLVSFFDCTVGNYIFRGYYYDGSWHSGARTYASCFRYFPGGRTVNQLLSISDTGNNQIPDDLSDDEPLIIIPNTTAPVSLVTDALRKEKIDIKSRSRKIGDVLDQVGDEPLTVLAPDGTSVGTTTLNDIIDQLGDRDVTFDGTAETFGDAVGQEDNSKPIVIGGIPYTLEELKEALSPNILTIPAEDDDDDQTPLEWTAPEIIEALRSKPIPPEVPEQTIYEAIIDGDYAPEVRPATELEPTAEPTVEPTTEPTVEPTAEPEEPDIEDIQDLGLPDLGRTLTTRFPFSIPWDFARVLGLLAAPPKTPRFEVDFFAPISDYVGGWQGSTALVLDFGEFEIIGRISRLTSTIGYCLMLIGATKRLIWTA